MKCKTDKKLTSEDVRLCPYLLVLRLPAQQPAGDSVVRALPHPQPCSLLSQGFGHMLLALTHGQVAQIGENAVLHICKQRPNFKLGNGLADKNANDKKMV